MMQNKKQAPTEVLKRATSQLQAAEVTYPAREALLLLAVALRKSKLEILTNQELELTKEEAKRFSLLLEQRTHRVPLAYIVGYKPFWKSDFLVSKATLIPRPETELVVETVLDLTAGKENLRVLDLGTGSGCILLSLLQEQPTWLGYGSDISSGALQIARKNAQLLKLSDKVEFFKHDYHENNKSLLQASYDVLVSNPPYLTSRSLTSLQQEVIGYEPKVALDGGKDGLLLVNSAIECANQCLAAGGLLVLEHGAGQGSKILDLLEAAGFENLQQKFDLAGIDRVVAATRKKANEQRN